MDELPGVLWAYRTIARKPTDISPFALTYGMEAIVLIEIGMPMLRTDIPEQLNTEYVIKDLDMVDELREVAVARIALYHRRLTNLYNRCAKLQIVQPGDLVPRTFFENTTDPSVRMF